MVSKNFWNESIDNQKNLIENINNLDELFALWKEAQENEDEDSCKKTFPQSNGESPDHETFKMSFCPDGFISSEDQFNGVLIICRESNVSGNQKMGEFKDTFALKNVASNNNRYTTFIKNALCNISAKDNSEVCNCAYININKRGGYSKCNMSQLGNYAEKYELFIRREIELIKPRTIVCGGTYDTVKDLIPKGDITILDCWHPCRGFHLKEH